MLISAYLQTFYFPTRISTSEMYEKNLYSVARRFSRFLGRPATLRDLGERNICAYLADYRRKWSARSTNNQRQILLAIWQDAADRTDMMPLLSGMPERRKIRKLAEEVDPPEAWDARQIGRLMRELFAQRGMICGVPAGYWWLSLGMTIYETSCRISSMLAVKPIAFDGRGVMVRKQKNFRPQWFRLSHGCCDLIAKTHPETRRLIWEHPWCSSTIWNKFRAMVEAAGLPAPKTGRQLFHRLRRTTITLCARVDQALAQRTAGHKEWATTQTHYVDPRMMDEICAADVLPDPLTDLRESLFGGDTASSDSPRPIFRIFG